MLMILALVAAVLLLFAAMFSRVPVRAARVLVVPGVPAMRAAWARATAGRSSAPASAAWRCVRRAAPGARSSSRPSAMRSLRGVRGGLRRRCRRRCSPRRPAAIRSAPASTGPGFSSRRPSPLWPADACASCPFGCFGRDGLSSPYGGDRVPRARGDVRRTPLAILPSGRRCFVLPRRMQRAAQLAAAWSRRGVCRALHSSPPLGFAGVCSALHRSPPFGLAAAYAASCCRRSVSWRRMQRAAHPS